MKTQWRKVIGDLRARRLLILLIGLVLAMGAAAVVAALNARAILQREVARSYRSAEPADVALFFDQVEPPLLAQVAAQPGVAAVDARRVVYTRVAGKAEKWFLMRLTIVRDFSAQPLGRVHLHGGDWDEADDGILIEQSGQTLLASDVGDELRIRTPAGDLATLPISGFVHDTAVAPSPQDRVVYGYVTQGAAGMIGQGAKLDQLLVKMKERGDRSDRASFANDLRDWLSAHGETPQRADALPDAHPHAALMATMLRVLQAFAFIALTCSAALALYVVSLWMQREIRQVGIMKTLGARSHQIAGQYLALVGPVVLAANLIAHPLGAWIGRALVRYYQISFNIDVADWSTPRSLLLTELLLTAGIPMVAMAVPLLRAARMTARKAIQDPGITAPTRARLAASRWLKMPGDRRWTFAIRNTFRRPGRLALTLTALSAGGALLLTANNTYESLMRVVDVSLGNQSHDLQVQLQKPVSAAEMAAAITSVPGIEIQEPWRIAGVTVVAAAGSESPRLSLLGYPTDSRLFRLPVKEGGLPKGDDAEGVVINRLVQEEVPGLRVGSELEMRFRDRRTKVRVSAIVDEIGAPIIYAAAPAFESITALGDQSSLLRVKTAAGEEDSVAAALDQALLAAHLAPGNIQTRAEFRNSLEEHFRVVCDVMRMVAVAAACLGVIILGASVGLNVLERAREIGVVRALGATPQAVRAIFLMESTAVALASAVLAIVVSIIFSRGLNGMASRELLHVAVPMHVSISGLAALFAGIAVALSGVALFLRRMLRISVRDALAYE